MNQNSGILRTGNTQRLGGRAEGDGSDGSSSRIRFYGKWALVLGQPPAVFSKTV
jgi:hypothetical protein